MATVFRFEKTGDYTVMCNHHLKSKEISMKAKGLLSQMLSLPDEWDYTLKGLARINKDGVDSIRSALNELEKAGYVVRLPRKRNDKGHLTVSEYVIYEKPKEPHKNVTHSRDSPEEGAPMLETPILEESVLESAPQESSTLDSSVLEIPTQSNTHRSNMNQKKKKEINNNSSRTYQSNPYQSIPEGAVDSYTSMVQQVKQLVKRNISYDAMCEEFESNRVNEIVSLMVETICARTPFVTISGVDHPHDLVCERLLSLNSLHIQYVFECLNRNVHRIANIKAYLLTTLFNAPATISNYYDACVRHDHPYLTYSRKADEDANESE